MLEHVDHVNLVVEDLPGMTAFYRDLLGMRVTREITIDGPWIEALTALAGAEADVVYLEPPSGPPIELLRYRTPPGKRPSDLGAANTPGIRHVAFRVSDLDAAVAALARAGIELISDVQAVPTSQVQFGDRQKRIVYCRDPEGNLLELCEYR